MSRVKVTEGRTFDGTKGGMKSSICTSWLATCRDSPRKNHWDRDG